MANLYFILAFMCLMLMYLFPLKLFNVEDHCWEAVFLEGSSLYEVLV